MQTKKGNKMVNANIGHNFEAAINDLKNNSEAFKKAAEGATKALPKPEQKGLMAVPMKEGTV